MQQTDSGDEVLSAYIFNWLKELSERVLKVIPDQTEKLSS